MDWDAPGVVLHARPYSEGDVIAKVRNARRENQNDGKPCAITCNQWGNVSIGIHKPPQKESGR